jgi:hypothetical protein
VPTDGHVATLTTTKTASTRSVPQLCHPERFEDCTHLSGDIHTDPIGLGIGGAQCGNINVFSFAVNFSNRPGQFLQPDSGLPNRSAIPNSFREEPSERWIALLPLIDHTRLGAVVLLRRAP